MELKLKNLTPILIISVIMSSADKFRCLQSFSTSAVSGVKNKTLRGEKCGQELSITVRFLL